MSAARQHTAALDPESLRAIETGAHSAPFNVLGVQRTAAGRLLRVNAPGAWRVEARSRRDRSMLAVLDQSHTPGLFAAPFEDDSPYLLRIYWADRIEEREDPYSFAPTISDPDLRALRDARVRGAGEILGARPALLDGVPGVRFALWAPDAASVAVAGDFNAWSDRRHPMRLREAAGVWELFVPRAQAGARYAFAVRAPGEDAGKLVMDPMARALELSPRPAAIVTTALAHAWRDERFLAIRRARRDCAPPVSIYRIEPDAWQAQEDRAADWRTLGERLPAYVSALGFTHVQIGRGLSGRVAPHWMFAPPPAHGDCEAFAAFVEACHEAGLGVVIEWDAASAFETAQGCDALAQNVLVDSAMHWLETYHLDGLSMTPPRGACELLNRLQAEIEEHAPGALLIVEDDLQAAQPYARLWRNDLMAAALGAPAAPLIGQSAAQLEGALLAVTPQALARFAPAPDAADPLAQLRAAYALAWLTPGAKLMHMGAELGQHAWSDGAVAWSMLDDEGSLQFLKLVRDLNNTLRSEAPIKLTSRVSQQMIWRRADDAGCIAYVRTGEAAAPLLVAMNSTPSPLNVSLEVPCGGIWREMLNTNSRHYGGADVGNCGGAHAAPDTSREGTFRLDIVLPQCGTIIFRHDC